MLSQYMEEFEQVGFLVTYLPFGPLIYQQKKVIGSTYFHIQFKTVTKV